MWINPCYWILIIIQILTLGCESEEFVSKFCVNNGFQKMIVFREKDFPESRLNLLIKSFTSHTLQFNVYENVSQITSLYQKIVYLYKSNMINLNSLLLKSPLKGILVVSLQNNTDFSQVSVPSLLYEVVIAQHVFNILMKLRNRDFIIENRLEVLKDGVAIDRAFDMKGAEIKTRTLSWEPYIKVDCFNGTEYCECVGYLNDVFERITAEMNFKLNCARDKNNFWGSKRLENGSWGGSLGEMFYGDSDISLNTWIINEDRINSFDFLEVMSGEIGGMIFMANKNADYELYFRPFTDTTWLMTSLIIIITLTYCVLMSQKIYNFMNTDSFKIIMASLGYFFVLLNAYYGGAMTMFFTTEVTIPFNNLLQVVLHPDWSIIYLVGDSQLVDNKLPKNHPQVDKYWSAVDKSPDDFVVVNDTAGLKRVIDDKVVYIRDKNAINYLLSSSKKYKQEYGKASFFDESKIRYYSLLPFNSPLTPSLQLMYLSLLERGVKDKAYKNWIRNEVSEGSEIDLMTLDLAQVSTVFLILLAASILALFFLSLEVLCSKKKKRQLMLKVKQKQKTISCT